MPDTDTNFPPGDFSGRTGAQFSNLYLVPPDGGAGYDDIFKVSNCLSCEWENVEVKAGFQRENAQNLNRESCNNTFKRMSLDA